MKIMALVTAKSYSTRVPYKNKKVIHGKPLYKWTTDFLNDNRDFFSSLVFSSDCPDSFNTGKGWLKLVRPPELLLDSSPHIHSVIQCLAKTEQINNTEYDAVFLFQPTNPIRNVKLLYHATAMLLHHSQFNPTSTPYESRCVYVDHNLNKSYLVGAEFGIPKGNPSILSGVLYVYNRERLVHPEKKNRSTYMYVRKENGYNINDELDIGITESFMKSEGMKYGS